jgi:hypothetical protein
VAKKPTKHLLARVAKGDMIRFRVTAEQKQALALAAERDGLELSVWLRRLALRAAGALPDAK